MENTYLLVTSLDDSAAQLSGPRLGQACLSLRTEERK